MRRTDTFDPVLFLYASLLRIFKAQTVIRTVLKVDKFFQPSDKKSHLPHADTNKSFRSFPGNRELDWTFCQFCQKMKYFFDFILQFWGSAIFLSWTLYLFFCKWFSGINQQLLCVSENDIRQGPSNHSPPLYELLFSVVWLILTFGEVSKIYRRMS